MSVTAIPAELRRLVERRADGICEYCLIAENDTWFGCHIDHVISEKHGGTTTEENLALACVACNRSKGSDIGSLHWSTGDFVRFFHPRTDLWHEHFKLTGWQIEPLTAVGEVTARILQFNVSDRLSERKSLIELGRYPGLAATRRMQA